MSAEATGWVFRYSRHSGATFTVHLAMADSVNDQNDNEFWMAVPNLARKARMTRRTTQRSVRALVECGDIEVVEDVPGRPTRYRMHFEGERNVAAPGSVMSSRGERNVAALTQTEPKERENNYSAAFEKAWSAYPRKDRKAGAFRAWKATCKRVGPSIKPTLILSAENYGRASADKESRFILLGQTFYGPDEPWRDYTTAPAAAADRNSTPAWMLGS